MQKTQAIRFGVSGSSVSDREGELGQLHVGRDPVSVSPAVFGLRALASLSLLFRLKGLLYHGANLSLSNCRRRRRGLDFGRCLANGCHQLFLC